MTFLRQCLLELRAREPSLDREKSLLKTADTGAARGTWHQAGTDTRRNSCGRWHCSDGHRISRCSTRSDLPQYPAASAEGLNVLRHANIGNTNLAAGPAHDAETTPLRDPALYQFDMNLPDITEVWRRGSVISSWLLDLAAQALQTDAELALHSAHVADSGEGRWTVQAAIDEGVPVPVLSAALYARFASRGQADFANRILSAMRLGFGGHMAIPADGPT